MHDASANGTVRVLQRDAVSMGTAMMMFFWRNAIVFLWRVSGYHHDVHARHETIKNTRILLHPFLPTLAPPPFPSRLCPREQVMLYTLLLRMRYGNDASTSGLLVYTSPDGLHTGKPAEGGSTPGYFTASTLQRGDSDAFINSHSSTAVPHSMDRALLLFIYLSLTAWTRLQCTSSLRTRYQASELFLPLSFVSIYCS